LASIFDREVVRVAKSRELEESDKPYKRIKQNF